MITALFFLWAIPNNLNDVLIRQFMKSFAISRLQAGFVQSAFYMGYFLLAMPAALLMRKYGYKFGFIVGLLLYCTGTILFLPAALVGQYWFFLTALFVIATGLSFLETASNPFIAQMGSPETSEQRLNFSQAFNPLGAITGVIIGKVFIFSGVELTPAEIAAKQAAGSYAAYLHSETLRVVKPYLFIAAIVLFWAVLILIKKFPAIHSEHEDGEDYGHFSDFFLAPYNTLRKEYDFGIINSALFALPYAIVRFLRIPELIKFRHFRLAVLAQFMYVGAQVGTWSYLIQYVQDYTHIPEKPAANYLVLTLVAFGVGRFASTALMRVIKANLLMGLFAIVNILLVIVGVMRPDRIGQFLITHLHLENIQFVQLIPHGRIGMWLIDNLNLDYVHVLDPGWIGVWAMVLTSFFMSLMFPTIFALGLKGLGPNTKIGGSLIVMAIVGGAILTPLMGWINLRTSSIAMAYLVPLAGYIVVALYAFFGSHLRAELSAATQSNEA
ncbi:MAG: sugar MFS transporter [Terracidiphilus sp.]